MSKTQFLGPKSQAGQAIVLIVFMIIVLFGAIGLAVDGGIAYYYNAAAERAAASAALAGVIFMPNQLLTTDAIPPCTGCDATDRALVAAKRNGFTDGAAPNIKVIVSRYTDPVSGLVQDESLQVTVSRDVGTYFMQLFGIPTIKVSRTAVAQYLKPVKLGEPCLYPSQAPGATGDCHTGSSVSQLGNGGYYILRTEGWTTDRGHGDAYTPSQTCGGSPECPSSDVHAINGQGSQPTDVVDPSLPKAGGYNYIVTVPAGRTAQIQVYNAAFAPDGIYANSAQNFCENWQASSRPPSPPNPPSCAPGATGCTAPPPLPGCAWYMHEDDSAFGSAANFATKGLYSAMEYTIFKAPSTFIRGSDTILSQMVVMPVDARNWKASSPNGNDAGGAAPYYIDVNASPTKKITQTYGAAATCAPLPAGCPTNMTAYHSWMNVGSYIPSNTCFPTVICTPGYEGESSIIKYNAGRGPIGALPAGIYRLRIDTLNPDGSIPPGSSQAHKGMAVRLVDGATGAAPCGSAAAPCEMSALDDISIYTPVTTAAGGNFRLPIFAVPALYAGLTISVDIFDAGDMGFGNGSIYIGLVDPTTCNLFVAGAQGASVVDLGGQRIKPLAPYPAPPASGTGGTFTAGQSVEQIVNDGTTQWGDNRWYHFVIPIPSSYAPGAPTVCDPTGQGYWELQYRTANAVTANDTITITVNLSGNPAHLLKS